MLSVCIPTKTLDLLFSRFMSLVERLRSYGVHFYHVKDRTGVLLCLGISGRGIAECASKQDKDLAKPRRIYAWKQLENLYFRDRKFSIEVHTPKRSVRFSWRQCCVRCRPWVRRVCSSFHNHGINQFPQQNCRCFLIFVDVSFYVSFVTGKSLVRSRPGVCRLRRCLVLVRGFWMKMISLVDCP